MPFFSFFKRKVRQAMIALTRIADASQTPNLTEDAGRNTVDPSLAAGPLQCPEEVPGRRPSLFGPEYDVPEPVESKRRSTNQPRAAGKRRSKPSGPYVGPSLFVFDADGVPHADPAFGGTSDAQN